METINGIDNNTLVYLWTSILRPLYKSTYIVIQKTDPYETFK